MSKVNGIQIGLLVVFYLWHINCFGLFNAKSWIEPGINGNEGVLHISSKLQDWSLTIWWFSVIPRTLIGVRRVLPSCRDVVWRILLPQLTKLTNDFKYSYQILIILFNIKSFVCTLLNGCKFSKWLNSSIWSIDWTLWVTTTPGQSWPDNNGNEGLLHISWSSRIAISPSDGLVS